MSGAFLVKAVKKVGKTVKKTVTKAATEVKKGAQVVAKATEKAAQKIIQCADAARLSAQVAAQETAYQVADKALEGAKGAVTLTQKTFDAATATLDAANATQKGLLDAADQAQKGVLKASDAVKDAGMEVAKGTLAGAALLTDLTADAIAQGFNIKKVHFEASFADLASGVLPKATVEGTVFGQSFNFKLDADFSDIEALAETIINKVFG